MEGTARKSSAWLSAAAGVLSFLIVFAAAGYFMFDRFEKERAANRELYKNEIPPQKLESMLKEPGTLYIYYYQPLCQACKAVSPVLMPEAEARGLPLYPVNIEGDEKLWERYRIEATPTLIQYVDGKEVKRLVGKQSLDDIRRFFGS
jgi:thiol-disulfide isomerase/thioredoxin